jgi:hypothetical protein
MSPTAPLDCVVIGYYEPPFEEYERLIRRCGVDSEAYRDLQFSFVDLDGRRRNYVDLLNYVWACSREGQAVRFPIWPPSI